MYFFQAEDGIRDIGVTGVQTCALPIFGCSVNTAAPGLTSRAETRSWRCREPLPIKTSASETPYSSANSRRSGEIGRASCRERVKISVVAVSLKKNSTLIVHYESINRVA